MWKKYSGHEIEYVPAAYLQIGPTDPPGSLLPKAADELPNLQNNNKYNVSITDNMEKKYDEVILTKDKMDLTNRKMKNQSILQPTFIIHLLLLGVILIKPLTKL